MKKAANDLIAADVTLATELALDTVCFHAQQAAEKSLKAILALYDISYPWRHDLAELLDLVKPLAPQIAPYSEKIVALTPYAVATRYDTEFNPARKPPALSRSRRMSSISAATSLVWTPAPGFSSTQGTEVKRQTFLRLPTALLSEDPPLAPIVFHRRGPFSP